MSSERLNLTNLKSRVYKALVVNLKKLFRNQCFVKQMMMDGTHHKVRLLLSGKNTKTSFLLITDNKMVIVHKKRKRHETKQLHS